MDKVLVPEITVSQRQFGGVFEAVISMDRLAIFHEGVHFDLATIWDVCEDIASDRLQNRAKPFAARDAAKPEVCSIQLTVWDADD